jgi:hypothetical protein
MKPQNWITRREIEFPEERLWNSVCYFIRKTQTCVWKHKKITLAVKGWVRVGILHEGGHCCLQAYSKCNIVKVVKSRRLHLTGRVVRIGRQICTECRWGNFIENNYLKRREADRKIIIFKRNIGRWNEMMWVAQDHVEWRASVSEVLRFLFILPRNKVKFPRIQLSTIP